MTDLIPRDAAIAAITLGRTISHPDPTCDHCCIDLAAIRDAALGEALSSRSLWLKFDPFGEIESCTDEPTEAHSQWIDASAILALIGEKK